jgi:hypothetical protein
VPQENILHYRILRPRAWTLRGPHTPEALELLKGVLARDDLTPALRSHALRMRAVNLSYAGDDSAGIKDLQDAIRLDPANPFNHIYLGISFREQGVSTRPRTPCGRQPRLTLTYPGSRLNSPPP